VKFGLGLSVQHLPEEPQAARFREHIEQVRLARAVGFSSVWASQHYLSDPFTYFQPIPTLARLAADARGMTLGTGVLLLPLHHPVEIAEQIAKLKAQPGKDLQVIGSSDLVQTLMEHDLVDEYRLMINPIVLGSGRRLFKDGSAKTALRLVDSKTTSTGVVILTYQAAGKVVEASATNEQ